ncbi:MAG: hypothetical protein RJA52_1093 [Bacteroidota bacterium]|jgi:hypothetical protein
MKREILLKCYYLGTDRFFPEKELDEWLLSLGLSTEGVPPEKLARALTAFYMLEKGASELPIWNKNEK